MALGEKYVLKDVGCCIHGGKADVKLDHCDHPPSTSSIKIARMRTLNKRNFVYDYNNTKKWKSQ